jgi:hypothetical protein
MSYDLYFRLRAPERSFSKEDFARYFSGRKLCEVKDSQAWYSNEVSGVYFSFDFQEPGAESDPAHDADPARLPVSFNLNYFRPHPFALEAEPEVAAFVAQFDLTVSDPQTSGMGDGEYSREGFLRGWNAGNAFAYRALLSHDAAQPVLTLPAAQIEASWRWNFDRNGRQAQIGDTVFVPRIFFFDVDGEARTGVAWGDAVPIFLPLVDLVLVPRQRLAPRRWRRAKEDIVVFTWAELEPSIRDFQPMGGEPDCYELFYAAAPPEIERVIREKRPPAELPKGLAFDQVLVRELVEQARAQQPTQG